MSLAPRSDILSALHAAQGAGFNDIQLYGGHDVQHGSGWWSGVVNTFKKLGEMLAPHAQAVARDVAREGIDTLAQGGTLKEARAAIRKRGRKAALAELQGLVGPASETGGGMSSKRRRVPRHPF